ncbi:MAG: hypothetical protein GTO40_13195, partial [Deltaproteobacteria bacterium]|nr:hypothetical protein [Deltaproteobacteria bacterium]
TSPQDTRKRLSTLGTARMGAAREPLNREQLKVLSVVCLAAYLFFNSYGSISVALPAIQTDLAIGLGALQWISFIGLVMVSSLSLCFGRAGDILGRNRLYRIGV